MSLLLSWRPSRDNRRVVSYTLYRNGAVVGRSRVPSARFTRLRCGTRNRLGVAAVDRAGNRSARASLRASTRPCSQSSPPPAPLPSGPFYVSPGGSDANPGSQAAPWRTVQKALNTLQAGQTAVVRRGTYAQDLVYDRGLPSWITLQGEPGAVLDGVRSHTLRVGGSGRFLRMKGFKILGAPIGSGGCIDLYGADVEITENDITGCGDQGVYTDEGSRRLLLARNRIHGVGGFRTRSGQSNGIYLQGDDHRVESNLVYDNRFGFGIQVYDYTCRPRVVNNTVVGNAHAGIVVGGGGSGSCGSGVREAIVRNNVAAFNEQHGIRFDGTAPRSCSIKHNLAFGNSGGSGAQYGSMSCASSNAIGDPRFMDRRASDFRLQAASPGIDAGHPSEFAKLAYDKTARPQGAAPDIGAYER